MFKIKKSSNMKIIFKIIVILILMNSTSVLILSMETEIKLVKFIPNSEYYYITNDNGANWQKVMTSHSKLDVSCIKFIPNSKYYYITYDNGVNWQKVYNKTLKTESYENDVSSLKIFPNPTNGNFAIEFTNTINENIIAYVKDITGRTVVMKEINSVNGVNTINITLPEVHTGMYYLELHTNQDILRSKLMIIE
jgi:hypothetical protein